MVMQVTTDASGVASAPFVTSAMPNTSAIYAAEFQGPPVALTSGAEHYYHVNDPGTSGVTVTPDRAALKAGETLTVNVTVDEHGNPTPIAYPVAVTSTFGKVALQSMTTTVTGQDSATISNGDVAGTQLGEVTATIMENSGPVKRNIFTVLLDAVEVTCAGSSASALDGGRARINCSAVLQGSIAPIGTNDGSGGGPAAPAPGLTVALSTDFAGSMDPPTVIADDDGAIAADFVAPEVGSGQATITATVVVDGETRTASTTVEYEPAPDVPCTPSSCASNQVCFQGQCCTPISCTVPNAEVSTGVRCGKQGDGCGGMVDCGECCPGGFACGTYTNSRGVAANCGRCRSGETCKQIYGPSPGVEQSPPQIGATCCSPPPCGSAVCGSVSDACGVRQCDIQSPPYPASSCVGGQWRCTPQSTAPAGACGPYDDGCGGTINVTCTDPGTVCYTRVGSASGQGDCFKPLTEADCGNNCSTPLIDDTHVGRMFDCGSNDCTMAGACYGGPCRADTGTCTLYIGSCF
jgi:hypothetical protein